MLKKIPSWLKSNDDNQSYDTTTDLLDRPSLINALSQLIKKDDSSTEFVFGVANIDQFKLINHSYGYAAGDYVLNVLAKTMSLEFDESTIIGRLGNDEFGFITSNKRIAQIQASCESLNFSLNHAPISWHGKKINIHIKFGLVPIDSETNDTDQILKAASEAIYSAQYDGYSTVCEYNEKDTAILRRSGNMQEAIKLQRWIARDQMVLFAQPIVRLDNHKKVSHFELLLRGKTDEGEIISPEKLVKAAEDFNIAPMLDKWVIRSLFSWINKHHQHQTSQYKFSLNISALSINDNELSDYIIQVAEKENINPRKINFEVTERVAISNLKRCYDFMMTLKKIGFSFSLDDFGSGYCSFKYIQTLPFDVIKIDGAFIKDIDTNSRNYTIVKAVNDIAKAYGRKTVAEDVENKKIVESLNKIGIDYGQGYYYSKPFSIDNLVKSKD